MKQMKSSTLLDSIVFQLTPTRTRCDLVINANGKTEKIASGLLNPFLAHLKAAQEQIGKGGYSIVLEPNQGSDAAWFTKGTVERFVRFVSSPEILERVYTIESEILQIQKAISAQKTNETSEHTVEDLPSKSEESIEGSKLPLSTNEETAIVLYQPDSHQQEKDGSTMHETNSKVQLIRVLEARKAVLQKEQGMAFARAVAASFDIDNISALLYFAECFGASRLMDACKRFVDLWKVKHESGQWVEVEATEAMSCRSDLPSMNASGIMFLGPNGHGETASEKNGISCTTTADGKPQADNQGQPNPQDYSPGQFPHPMFPPWQMHPQANGMPAFQPYPVQGMPYYQNYPGNTPFFQPPYSPYDDPRLHSGQRTRQRRHSMDSRDLSADSETQENDTDEEDSVSRRTRKRGGKSSRKTVVIRNINYIASGKQGSSNSDPESCSDADEKRELKASDREERMSGQAGDDGHWQAFQNFLLKDADDESSNSVKNNMFEMEGKAGGRKRQSAIGDAASGLGGRDTGKNHDVGFTHEISVDNTRMRKPINDQMLSYGQSIDYTENQTGPQFTEGEGRRGAYRRDTDANMDYMINRPNKLTDVWDSSLDPVIANGFQGPSKGNNDNKGSSNGVADESFMIMHRSGSLDQGTGSSRTAMDMDYECKKAEDHSVGTKGQSDYEPHDLNLIPDRGMEGGPSGYDPALDYEMQSQVKEAANLNTKKVATDAKQGPKKGVKDLKLKTEKRTPAGPRREKPSKFSPSEDARARAERLRAFKADLQKLKKEKEEEQQKRIEALKMERQKRIAARSGTNPAKSSLPSQQVKKHLPKLSPVSQKGSKFSDGEPGSSSPLQRSTLKTISKLSAESYIASNKSGRLNNNTNRLTRSASSLSVRKEENSSGITPESKAIVARIRRLSEPKTSAHPIPSAKPRSVDIVSRKRVSEGAEQKKTVATANPDKPKSVRKRPSNKDLSQKKETSEDMLQKTIEKIPSHSDGDDNMVIEKNVVVLECEKPSIPFSHVSEEKRGVPNTTSEAYSARAKSEDDVAVPPPASPINVKEVNREPSEGQVKVKEQSETRLNETVAASRDKVLPNVANDGTHENPYQPPYARVSSIEDPCMVKSDHGKAPPTSLEPAAAGLGSTTVHVRDIQRQEPVKKSEVASAANQGKESSKGFKRLLKFGKKHSSGSESNIDLDKGSLESDHSAMNGSSNEVFTLKNLLIQEESSSAGTTPKKSSRSFSLLSPFRSKTSEKKLST